MKKSFEILTILLFPFIISCRPESVGDRDGGDTAIIRADFSGAGKKSALVEDELAIRNVCVAVYRGGRLFKSYYTDGNAVDMELFHGDVYNLSAVANCGRCTFPMMETDLASMRVDCSADAAGGGVPMATEKAVSFCVDDGSDTMPVRLERLAAKYRLSICKQLEHGDFELGSVALKQAALDVTPFSSGSVATRVSSGDYASPGDVARLNNGGEASFYAIENCMGVLLPGNEDQWGKVPENVPDGSDKCTYLELKGRWTTAGASADMTYRMYLGRDNCSDFNVDRNTDNAITLTLTDDGTLAASWKVEMDGMDDRRRLSFVSKKLVIYQGGAFSDVAMDVYPEGLDYEIHADAAELADAAISYTVRDGRLSVSSVFAGPEFKTARLVASTWDGKVSDTLEVSVEYKPGAFKSYTHEAAGFVAEWGNLSFPEATLKRPVRLYAAGRTFDIKPAHYLVSTCDSIQVDDAHLKLYYVPGTTQVYYSYEGVSASPAPSVTVLCGDEQAEISLPRSSYARYWVSGATLSETADRLSDTTGEFYDADISVSLKDHSDLRYRNFKSFAVPDEILEAKGEQTSFENRYGPFRRTYLDNHELSFSFKNRPYAVSCDDLDCVRIQDGWNDASFDNNASLSKYRLWGIDAEGENVLAGTVKASDKSGTRSGAEGYSDITITAAFPSQRYLGSVCNMQAAPGFLKSTVANLSLTSGGHPAPDIEDSAWTIHSAFFDSGERPSASMIIPDEKGDLELISFNNGTLSFSEPDISRNFYPSGAFILEGGVTNRHTGKQVKGYYTFDIELFVSVITQIDFPRNLYVAYSFVPFTIYSKKQYAEVLNDRIPPIPIRCMMADGTYAMTRLHVPETDTDTSQMTTSMQYGSFSPTFGLEQVCLFLTRYCSYSVFSLYDFCLDGKLSETLMLNRESYAGSNAFSSEDYVKGRKGYFRLYKQIDIGNMTEVSYHYGFDNILIEAAYNSLYY